MTRQIPDTVIYKDQRYALAGLKGKGLLTPTDLNIAVQGFATACDRGYYCQYTCIDDSLFLTELILFTPANQLQNLGDIVPVKYFIEEMSQYKNLKIQCPFSGGLVIVQNLIEPVGVVPNPLKYEKVVEINFEQGLLQGEMDHSSKVNILRSILDGMLSKLTDVPSELPGKLSQWISSPEQLPEQESEKFRRYFDEVDRLEWSFVEGYEQQPSTFLPKSFLPSSPL